MSVRFALNLLYLAALFALCGALYLWITGFEGHMPVQAGAAEHLVVREAAEAAITAQRRLPPDLLPFANPGAARLLDANTHYDAATLPFHLHLASVEVLEERPPREVLVFRLGRETREETLDGSGTVCFGDECLYVTSSKPWTGIVFRPGGRPMALVALALGNTEARTVLEPGRRTQTCLGFVGFEWFEDAEAAEAGLPDTIEPTAATRWGVRDGNVMHWMTGPSPGQGIVTNDGVDYTVLDARLVPGEAPVLRIRIEDSAGSRVVDLQPGEAQDDLPLHFEAPTFAPLLLQVNGYRDGGAWVACYEYGRRKDTVQVEAGSHLTCGDTAVRVEQVMSSAVAVVGDDLSIFALQIADGDGVRTLREGDAVSWQEGQLRYRRLPRSPKARYHFAARAEGEKARRFALEEGGRARVGSWHFRLADEGSTDEFAMLAARRGGFARPSAWIGAALLVVGAFGSVCLRFGPARPRRSPPRSAETGLRD